MLKRNLLLLLLLVCGMAFAQKPIFTSAKVTAATVYYSNAELTQTTTLNLPAGTSEIVIKNVADYVNENTVQIGAPESLTVLSVQFTRDYISEYEHDEASPALRKVHDSIVIVKKTIEKISGEKYNEQKTIELLDLNRQAGGQNSGLSVAELIKLADYYKAKRNELNVNYNALAEKEKKLNELLEKLNTRLATNTQKEDKTSQGKLVLQVMNSQAGNVPLEIKYLTAGAGWVPFYDLRADNTSGPINMMYKARVQQTTGIDWKKVKLTLSSGSPNQNSIAPELGTWFLQMQQPRIYGTPGAATTAQSRVAGVELEKQQLDEVMVQGYRSATRKMSTASVSQVTTINENQLNVSFDIDIPYDVASNGKAHSVSLKEIKLPATHRHYAVPRVEKEAFLLAEITDYGKYNLLPGEANIIFDKMYIGKTTILPNQTGDTLSLSMGRDKKVSITREKIADKSGTKFLSSYKEQTFTYETVIRNNKKESVSLQLKDQYPVSTDKEVEVTLLKDDGAKIDTETGIMTWELKLSPGETRKIRISYKVKYPKSSVIPNL
ncbi:DUF4139 domain-containing protein [Flavobacterium psychrotrophum]|uniref:DUF4139 domain-containing protein n=1 Tax=Flavobacterium psychrotrophum TaxID=2294119 RepID=UPI000E31DA44|nr:DUF4139 domain-containing protein [Flavobacterium psychrotrophum]